MFNHVMGQKIGFGTLLFFEGVASAIAVTQYNSDHSVYF
jgi:hypothetical protein